MTKAIACELPRRTKQPVSRLYVPDIRAELMELHGGFATSTGNPVGARLRLVPLQTPPPWAPS